MGRCVDCEGGRAQIFGDCAITKYLSRATARGFWGTVLTVALLNNPGLQGTPAARSPSPRRSASIEAPAATTVLIGRTTVLQCCVLLPACLRFLHTVKHFRIGSYRIVSCPLWLYRAIARCLTYVGMPNGRNVDQLDWQPCHAAKWWL